MKIKTLKTVSFLLLSTFLYGQEKSTLLNIIQNSGIEISEPDTSLYRRLEVMFEGTSHQWITLSDTTCNANYIYNRKLEVLFIPKYCGGEAKGEYCTFDILNSHGHLLATWKFKSENQTFHSFEFYYNESPELKKEVLMRDNYKNRSKGDMSWRRLRKARLYSSTNTLDLSGDEFVVFFEDVLKLRRRLKPDMQNKRRLFPYNFCHHQG